MYKHIVIILQISLLYKIVGEIKRNNFLHGPAFSMDKMHPTFFGKYRKCFDC